MSYKKETLSIELPNPVFASLAVFDTAKKAALNLYDIAYSNFQDGITKASFDKGIMKKFGNIKLPSFRKFKFNKNNLLKIVLPVVGIVVVVVVLGQIFAPRPSIQGAAEVQVDQPIAFQKINKDFNFPLRDSEGEEVGSFKYTVESVEKRKQIIVKGQRATSVEGRVFLIVNLKLVNDLDQSININTRDYIRIYVNGREDELFAPDIHNDPVETQAISIKNTRVGIAINESDNDITLKIGEINGEKEEIKLEL